MIAIDKSIGEKRLFNIRRTLERVDKEKIIEFVMFYYEECQKEGKSIETSRMITIMEHFCGYNDYCV